MQFVQPDWDLSELLVEKFCECQQERIADFDVADGNRQPISVLRWVLLVLSRSALPGLQGERYTSVVWRRDSGPSKFDPTMARSLRLPTFMPGKRTNLERHHTNVKSGHRSARI